MERLMKLLDFMDIGAKGSPEGQRRTDKMVEKMFKGIIDSGYLKIGQKLSFPRRVTYSVYQNTIGSVIGMSSMTRVTRDETMHGTINDYGHQISLLLESTVEGVKALHGKLYWLKYSINDIPCDKQES